MLAFAKIASQDKTLKAVAILGLAAVAFNLPLPTVTVFEPIKPISGLLQRLFTAGWFLWLILTSLSLYKKTVAESAE